ncbi:hypothetical protein GGS24DRAFT_473585 [Hypoxylon argillaceum]|nr:hypothetical protein GGS24DRAFT_473585 [Hypoxylon argillaceum]
MSVEDDVNPPCWIPDPLLKQHSPESFVIYIVAQIGTTHRPLSVLTICMTDTDSVQADEIIILCRCLSGMLADPSNRMALASELSLAADFYLNRQGSRMDSFVHELPKTSAYEYFAQPDRDDPVYRGFPEFPFVSTCLMLAGKMSSCCPARLQPLGTRFRDHNPSYGMVVFDISDLDHLRYGIVAFSVEPMVFVRSREEWMRWDGMDQELGGERELRVEEHRPRTPLSVHEFAAKSGVTITDDASAFNVSLVEPSAFQLIWPSDSLQTGSDHLPQTLPQSSSSRDSSDATLVQRIEEILRRDGFTLSHLNGVRKLRSFQLSLRRLLQENPELLYGSQAPELLGLVFEAETHLNLIPYDGPSGELIRTALDKDELKHIQSIVLSLDKITGTPAHLANTLFRSSMKHDLYVLQSPGRDSDEPSIEFLQELCKVPGRTSPDRRIVISGIYSSALRHQPWMPASGPGLPTSAFPVSYIFHRTQSNARRPSWTTRGVYVGHAMLSPLPFAAGFLRWLGQPGTGILAFAAGAPDLKDLERSQVSPIPVEQTRDAPRRPLVRGAWCVVVSTEIQFDHETRRRNMPRGGLVPCEARYVGFAFVRLLVDVVAQGPPVAVTAKDIQVCGLAEFLEQTLPTPVDAALVRQRLGDVGERISHWPWQGKLTGGVRWLRDLNVEETVEVLNMGLASTFSNPQR